MAPIDPPDPGAGLPRPIEVDACSCGCGAERDQPCAERPTDPSPGPTDMEERAPPSSAGDFAPPRWEVRDVARDPQDGEVVEVMGAIERAVVCEGTLLGDLYPVVILKAGRGGPSGPSARTGERTLRRLDDPDHPFERVALRSGSAAPHRVEAWVRALAPTSVGAQLVFRIDDEGLVHLRRATCCRWHAAGAVGFHARGATEEQLGALRREASEAGNGHMRNLAELALDGNAAASAICARYISEAPRRAQVAAAAQAWRERQGRS